MRQHVMAYAADDYELRTQTRWCRRCGRLLWSKRFGNRHGRRPCRTVRITLREEPVPDLLAALQASIDRRTAQTPTEEES